MGLEKETQKYGIENIKKVFALGFAFGEASHKTRGKDASWLEEAKTFFESLDEVAALFTIDGTALKEEFYDLDQSEMAELKAFGKEKYNIPENELEGKIEASVFHGITILQAASELADVWKESAA